MKLGIFIAYFLLLSVLISVSQFCRMNIGANTIARLATIESIVERHTYVIDDSSLPPTCDKVLVRGHFYGCQPPLLQTMVAPMYFILKAGGLSMAGHLRAIYALLTIFTVGVLSSLMLALFYGLMSLFGLDEPRRLLATFAFGVGTLILPYSTILSPQIIGGSFIFFALYLTLRGLSPKRAFLAGLFLGTAAAIDVPPGGIFSVFFIIYLLSGGKYRRLSVPAVLGWLIPFTLHCMVNVPITGSVLPGGVIPEYFEYPASEWSAADLGGVASHESISAFFVYVWHSLIGYRGLLLFNPVLLFPAAVLLAAVFSRRWTEYRAFSIYVLSSIFATAAYYLVKTVNYGGWSYGMRFFVPLIPPLAIYMGPFLAVRRGFLIKCIFILSLAISVGVSLIGVLNPQSDMYIGPSPIANNMIMAFGNLAVRPPSCVTRLAMRINEGDGTSLYYLGRKFQLYGWKDCAAEAFAGAVRADPADPGARLSLASAYYDIGDMAGALDEYNAFLSDDPEYIGAACEYDIARGAAVIRVAGEDVAARNKMALLLAAVGRSGEAAVLVRDYLDNGEVRLRERFRGEGVEGEMEVVYPRSRAGLELLLKRLEEGGNMKRWKYKNSKR